MKPIIPSSFPRLAATAVFLLVLPCCKKPEAPPAVEAAPEANPLVEADTPALAIQPGQEWRYEVTIENPHDIRTGGSVTGKFERTRRYKGKVDPGNSQPPADCFEVRAKGTKITREFILIEPEQISLLGQAEVDEETGVQSQLIWFEHPIPFFKAGLSAGDSLPGIVLNQGTAFWRVTRVIGREKVEVPAGEFDSVRLQMMGKDRDVLLRKTYWFAPGIGIVRGETVREVNGKPVLVETDELIQMTPGTPDSPAPVSK